MNSGYKRTVGRKRVDYAGFKFNKITITEIDRTTKEAIYWKGFCACGNSVVISSGNIKKKVQYGCRSCGSKKGHPLQFPGLEDVRSIWLNAISRCHDPKDIAYKYYGKRGIKVCREWRKDFWVFVKNMGPRPPKFTLERIDNNGNYCKKNCKWIPKKEQSRNRRSNRLITIKGKTKLFIDWLRYFKMCDGTYYYRVKIMGMSPVEALTTPRRKRISI